MSSPVYVENQNLPPLTDAEDDEPIEQAEPVNEEYRVSQSYNNDDAETVQNIASNNAVNRPRRNVPQPNYREVTSENNVVQDEEMKGADEQVRNVPNQAPENVEMRDGQEFSPAHSSDEEMLDDQTNANDTTRAPTNIPQ